MNFLKWSHYILGLVPKAEIKDNLPEYQLSAGCRYIERCPNISFSKIISNIKWVHATYRDLGLGVKS
jgi:hypothetical protein